MGSMMSSNDKAPLWKRVIARVGLDYLALALFLLIFGQLLLVYGAHVRFRDGSVIWPTVVLVAIIAARFASRIARSGWNDVAARRDAAHEAAVTLRDWVPLILLILVYENLRGLTGHIRPDNIDGWLYDADVALFGVEPTVWIQRFANPWLTDYFAFSYMLYFILPLVLATTLYVRRKYDDFRTLMLDVLLVQYVGFLLYITFPAGPPRFAITAMYDPPHLTGALGLYQVTQSAYDSVNSAPAHSSFPSLHCALSLTALLWAWRFRRSVGGSWMFWVFLPFTVSLWISTVYLRHHWVVDIFAGWALAIAVFVPVPYLHRWYGAFRGRVLVEPATAAAAGAASARENVA